ncbi:MAG TPA: hypothetical protein VMT97_10700 [Terriglobales bacterium]|nr:hypothetical protein [Terriglobales bacterium]
MSALDGRPESSLATARLAVALGAAPLVALVLPHVVGGGSVSAAARVCAATLTVVVVPGSLLVLVAGHGMRLGLLETLGLGVPVSLSLVQVATMASLGFHTSSAIVGRIWLALALIGAALAAWRVRRTRIRVPRYEIGIGALMVILGCLLYLKGSPFAGGEDWSHAGIVRRLASLEAPAITNFYHSPDVLYTHPLPGTHYAMALVSTISGLDPLFIYHKMRFLWSVSATLVLYALARFVFEDDRIAAPVLGAALLLTLNGTFADIPIVAWAQLATFSHPSDVALGVLLPGLLALTACCLRTLPGRPASWSLAAALSMAATLTMVHIRETVQFLVYLASFAVALAVFRRDRRLLRRIFLLAAVTVVITVVYVALHRAAGVAGISELDRIAKAELVTWFRRARLRDLIGRPLPISVGVVDSLLHGWMPGVLLLSPLLWLVHRRRVLVWLPAASIVAYMLLIRFPILSFPYVYFTYWEILLTPGRNVAVFVHLFAGLAMLALATHLSGIRGAGPAAVVTLLAGSGVAVVMRGLGPRLVRHQDLLFLGVLAGYVAVLFLLWRREGERVARAVQPGAADEVRPWVYALLVTVAAAVSVMPHASPLNLSPADRRYETLPPVAVRLTPRGLIEGLRCTRAVASSREAGSPDKGIERISCPPSVRLVEWAAQSLPATAVLAGDTFNAYPLPAFIPQQVAAWPLAASENLADASGLYPAYYERFERTMKRFGGQPFFNSVENWSERAEFLGALRVTHIVVDPPYQGLMARILGQWPEAFATVYDDGAWTVYEVKISSRGQGKR